MSSYSSQYLFQYPFYGFYKHKPNCHLSICCSYRSNIHKQTTRISFEDGRYLCVSSSLHVPKIVLKANLREHPHFSMFNTLRLYLAPIMPNLFLHMQQKNLSHTAFFVMMAKWGPVGSEFEGTNSEGLGPKWLGLLVVPSRAFGNCMAILSIAISWYSNLIIILSTKSRFLLYRS